MDNEFYQLIGSLLGVYWEFVGRLLGACWELVYSKGGSHMMQCKLRRYIHIFIVIHSHIGSILAPYWLHIGSILAPYWLQKWLQRWHPCDAICNICYDPPWHKKYVTIFHVHIFLILFFSTTHRWWLCAYRTSFSHLNPTFFLLRHTHCLMDFYMLASCFLDPPRALHLTFDHDAAPILTYLVLHTLTHLFLYYFLFLTSTFPFIYSHYTFFFTIIYILLSSI